MTSCSLSRSTIKLPKPSIDGLVAFFAIFLSMAIIIGLNILYNNQIYQYIIGFQSANDKQAKCDVGNGHWVRVHYKSSSSSYQYTNSSCLTIPDKNNCFKHGRMDRDFLDWRWMPERCDLSSFDALLFREIVRGKTMGFVGDSVGRNQMDSLLCLLSTMEASLEVYKDAKDRNRIYHFAGFNFTLRSIWTKYLVFDEEKVNGRVDLRLEKMNDNWAKELHSLDYLIISTGQWFFRPMYIHEESKVVACVYCNDSHVPLQGVQFAIQVTLRAALRYINGCENCGKLVAIVRTLSPSHFENGGWNTGGKCERVEPLSEKGVNFGGLELEIRDMEAEEVERVNKVPRFGMQFHLMDVTKAMIMRADGHPGAFWRDKKKGSNDCVHWCLPGPIDIWNDLLLNLLIKHN